MKKHFFVLVALVLLTIGTLGTAIYASVGSLGSDVVFQQYLIYGNQYSMLARGGVRYSPYNKFYLIVDNMYKADGGTSDYTKSKWSVTDCDTGAICVSDVVVKKGVKTPIQYTNGMAAGRRIGINVRGNVDNLNARISGAIYGFQIR